MAGLVDYSSDEEAGEVNKDAAKTDSASEHTRAATPTALPPLPRSFLDLYATNVRTSTADDPSLHQGRTRATPHVAGRWPSHIYVEWFPTSAEHAALTTLLTAVRDALPPSGHSAVHSLLTSDLGAPLSLHISLSRPFTLRTAEKTAFLERLVAAVSSSRVEPFHVFFSGLCWFRSPDSPRAFLVLRVTTSEARRGAVQDENRPLVSLLARCNDHVAAVGQPTLYARPADPGQGSHGSHGAASAFHVSIAWTLSDAIDDWAQPTTAAYDVWQQTPAAALRIHVDSIKAKIGNVVSDMPLAAGERQTKRARTNLLGL